MDRRDPQRSDSFAVAVDGVTHNRDHLQQIATNSVLLVEVATGASATLRMTSRERTQSLDLRTGKRGPDAVAAYHPYRSGIADLTTRGRSDIGTTVAIGLDVTVNAAGYDEQESWAPTGHVARMPARIALAFQPPHGGRVTDTAVLAAED